jgi:hypothetical protein
MLKTKKQPEPVKILASGKVSIKMSAAVLGDLIAALEEYLSPLYNISRASMITDLRDVVLVEMYATRFARAMAVRALTLRASEALALREAWKRSRIFRESNMLNVLLMKLDQKLG